MRDAALVGDRDLAVERHRRQTLKGFRHKGSCPARAHGPIRNAMTKGWSSKAKEKLRCSRLSDRPTPLISHGLLSEGRAETAALGDP